MADPQFGSEVAPSAPQQDMTQIDIIAGGPAKDRTAPPGEFTGGDSGMGLGGTSEGGPEGGEFYERIGF